MPILTAEHITLRYRGLARDALRDVSIAIHAGRVVGIVGESGSGKSSLARCLLGLEKLHAGTIRHHGHDIHAMDRAGQSAFRRKVQMVFQDPFNSLNPRMTIGAALDEVLRVHRIHDATAASLLTRVGLDPAMVSRHPHELSGGQRQRVGIARALAVGPEVIIADEPVSALDVSVQAHILNLLRRLVDETGVTLVLIAHDLAVVRNVCDEVAVMSEGAIVEEGPVEQVIGAPAHPYTQTLLAAVPAL